MAGRTPRERHPFGTIVWGIFSAAFTLAVAVLLNQNLAIAMVLWVAVGVVAVALLEGAYWADYKLNAPSRTGGSMQIQASPQSPMATPALPVSTPQPILRPPELARAATAQQEPVPRIIVDRTPEQLLAQFQGVTNVQGRNRVAPYIGKWLAVSGPLGNVLGSYPDSVQVTFANRSMFDANDVYAYFREKKWSDQLEIKDKGDEISLIGRITDIDSQTVRLDNCELR